MQSPADAMSCTRYATSTNSFPPVYVKRERRGENPEKLTGIQRFEAGCMLCKRRACDPLPLRTEALRRLPPYPGHDRYRGNGPEGARYLMRSAAKSGDVRL